MFRDRVKEHYRVRGYTLHEGPKVRGRSGTVYRCDLVAEGPLGSLIINFGDAGGFEGPELQAVKRTAQDIGAGAVVAARSVDDGVQQAAREHGIILLDGPTLDREDGPRTAEDDPFRAHPWPDPDRRPQPKEGPAKDLWSHPRQRPAPGPATGPMPEAVPEPAPQGHIPRIEAAQGPTRRDAPRSSFDWLPRQGAARPRPLADPPTDPVWKVRERPATTPAPPAPLRWVLAPLLYGLATAVVLFLLILLF